MKKNKIKTHYVVYEDVYEERRGLSFGMKLLIYALVLGVLIAGGVMLLRRALSRYEAAQPDRVVESYIATNARSAFYHAILRIYPDDENTYEPCTISRARLPTAMRASSPAPVSCANPRWKPPCICCKAGTKTC